MARPHAPKLPNGTYPAARIFGEDLDDLLAVFCDAGYDVELRDDTHVFDSLDDVRDLRGDHPRKLVIAAEANGTSAHLILTLNHEGVDLYSYGDGIQELATRVQQLVEARQPVWMRGPQTKLRYFLTGMVTGLAIVMLLTRFAFQYPWIVLALSALWLPVWTLWEFGGGIWLTRRHSTDFWRIHADKLRLAVASGILGSLLTLGVLWALKRWIMK